MLLALHAKFGRWMQLGGHFEDGDRWVTSATLREAAEESGLHVAVDSEPLSVGVYPDVPCPAGRVNAHHDIRSLARVATRPTQTVSYEPDDVARWPLDDLPTPCTTPIWYRWRARPDNG